MLPLHYKNISAPNMVKKLSSVLFNIAYIFSLNCSGIFLAFKVLNQGATKYARLLTILMFFIMSGCSNNYNIHSAVNKEIIGKEFAAIQLAKPNTKYLIETYIAFEHLLLGIPSSLEKKYILNININFNYNPLLVNKNSDIVRESVIAYVNYALTDIKNKSILHKGMVTLRSSHNLTDPAYATYVGTENISMNLAAQIAEEIYKKLFIYFYHNMKNI